MRKTVAAILRLRYSPNMYVQVPHPFFLVPPMASLCARRGAKNTRSAFCSGFGPRAGAFSRNSEVLNKKEGGVGRCSKALIGSTRGAPSTPQLRQERRSGTFPRTVMPTMPNILFNNVGHCNRTYMPASCTSSSLGCVVQEVLVNFF